MATFKVEDVPIELLNVLRLKAASEGRTVRAVVLEWLEWIADGEQVAAVEAAPEAKKGSATASPRRRSSRTAKPSARKPAQKKPQEEEQRFTGEIKPCSHGLLFHPGCPDQE